MAAGGSLAGEPIGKLTADTDALHLQKQRPCHLAPSDSTHRVDDRGGGWQRPSPCPGARQAQLRPVRVQHAAGGAAAEQKIPDGEVGAAWQQLGDFGPVVAKPMLY